MRKKGLAVIPVIAIVALVGMVVALVKPSIAKSNAKKVDSVTALVSESTINREGEVSASLNEIEKANALAEESPTKKFIATEIPLVKSLISPATYEQQLAAEKRRVAVMEGKLEEAAKLYKEAYKDNSKLIAEKIEADKELTALKNDLHEQAGAAEFLKKIVICTTLIAVVVLILFIYTKLQHTTVMSGVREFVTYTKDDATLASLREAFDKSVKKKLGL